MRLFVYKVTNTATGKALDYQELRKFCIKHKLTMVPVLEVDVPLPKTLDDILTHCQGYSILSHHPKEQPLLREGLVYRCMTNQELSFKAKSREYAVWFEKGRKTE